jgi:type IX secretion system PorP/SprF family membrane protein
MNKQYSILLISLFLSVSLMAQDVHFSQFGQTPQLINPGATGVFGGSFRGILNYRTQWGSVGEAYNTYAASFDLPVFKKDRGNTAYLGLGANFYKDVAGNSEFGNFLGSVSASGILPVGENHTLSLGIQAGFGQYSAQLAQITWGSQFNGSEFDLELNSNESFGNESSNYIDLGTGVFYQFSNTNTQFLGSDMSGFNVGVAAYHLNKPKQNFLSNTESEIPMKIIAQAAGTFDVSGSSVALVPSVFYATQGPYSELTPGVLIKLRFGASTKYTGLFKESAVYFGAHYRVKDAIIPQLKFEFTDYMIGISYDYNTSSLSEVSGGNGGLEVSIRYINKPKAIQRASFK